jgi:aspartyl-tRNA(Asn)/glutamyl-tRNA(Gln) amidotransferase subunit A
MARDGAFDDRFKAALKAAGLKLTTDETSGVEKLAAWMHDGLAAQELPPAPAGQNSNICDLDIFALGARLRDGRLTAKALTEATLARISERDPAYLSFYRVLEESALAEAARADRELTDGIDRGPLHGIPVGIKDVIDVAGVPTTANAPGRADAIADSDAEVVRRLRSAGAVIIGKLATYEWATVGPDSTTLPAAHRRDAPLPWQVAWSGPPSAPIRAVQCVARAFTAARWGSSPPWAACPLRVCWTCRPASITSVR